MNPQKKSMEIDPMVAQAVGKIEEFVENATGKRPEPEELSQALTKYFVLKEILDFIKLSRQEGEGAG